MDDLTSGDLLFFTRTGLRAKLFKFIASPIYHVGMVVMNLPSMEYNTRYILHTYQNYQEEKYEIRLDKLEDFIKEEANYDEILIRHASPDYPINHEMLDYLCYILPGIVKKHNILDWIYSHVTDQTFISNTSWKQAAYHNTSRYWSSCFVSYLYYSLGWMKDGFDWMSVSPDKLSSTDFTNIRLEKPVTFIRDKVNCTHYDTHCDAKCEPTVVIDVSSPTLIPSQDSPV